MEMRDPQTSETTAPVRQKLDLTAQVIDALLFQGPIMGALKALLPVPILSIQAILQSESNATIASFLSCVNAILPRVQDDQVGMDEYGACLVEEIRKLQSIVNAEHARAASANVQPASNQGRSKGIFRRQDK